MTFRKIIGTCHLWLGLASGLLVVFLALTGCILVFEHEIQDRAYPFLHVKEEQRAYLVPSVLKAEAEKHLDGKKVITLEYPSRDRSAMAFYYDANTYYIVFLNPYNGQVLKVKNMNREFFRIVTIGHYYLWLPPAIGQPIVATATLVFTVMLISGIVLWWPRNRAARRQRFSIKWKARWRRVNYDLHNVLGFYASWIGIFIALSGMVMGFQWFAKTVYWVSSGGSVAKPYVPIVSDTSKAAAIASNTTDRIWLRMQDSVPAGGGCSVTFPSYATAPVDILVKHDPGNYYQTDSYHFDQYTMQRLPASGTYDGKFAEARPADKLARMNYDIHVGAIGGLPTKIIAFLASLTIASLPITGFLVWRGRRRKKKG